MEGKPEQNAGTINDSNPEHLLFLRNDAGTINESNLEHLPRFKGSMWCDPEENEGTIHESNPENLLAFKAPRGNDPRVQSVTTPCF